MTLSEHRGAARPVVFLNNSRETFTPTASGAIATCIWEVLRSTEGLGASAPVVVTNASSEDPYPWSATRFLEPPAAHEGLRAKGDRIARRLTGWARPDQRVFAQRALPVLRELDPSVVILSNDPEIAVFLRRRMPDTVVLHWFHNLEIASDRFRRAFARDTGLRSVAVSGYLARAVEQVYRLDPLSVSVALNGVDTDRFTPGSTRSTPTVGFLGRMAVEKAPDTLLRSCLLLASRGLSFNVQLVGDTNWGFSSQSPFLDEIDRLVAALQVAGVAVTRTGHLGRAAVAAALQDCDIHVVPSRWDEPCGLTVLEGLASGQAVVATATGGTPELLGGAGVLFPRDDVEGLAGVLERLLADPAERDRLGQAGRARAERLRWSDTWHGLRAAAGGPAAPRGAQVMTLVPSTPSCAEVHDAG